MNLKLKALLHTVALLGSAVIAGSVVNYLIIAVDAETLRNVVSGAVLGAMVYLVYRLCLTRLEFSERFDKK